MRCGVFLPGNGGSPSVVDEVGYRAGNRRCSITQRTQPGSLASWTASSIRAWFQAHAPPSLSASAVVVARRPAAHTSRSDLR